MRLSSSSAASSWSSRYSLRKPSKAMIEPVARSRGPFGLASATSTVTWSNSADCIWLATARFQTSS